MAEATDVPRQRPPKWVPVALTSLGESARPESPAQADESRGAPPPEDKDPIIGRIFGGKFRVVGRLGHGGMAVVYLAEETGRLKREVAIKLLTPESELSPGLIARFFKEAQAIAAIRHPNVVQLIDLGETETGQIYMVMERLVGMTLQQALREMLARGEVFTWDQLAPLMAQICSALHAAHKQKIVHRDMKPSNCFCCDVDEADWHIKILDFGIAKAQINGGVSVDSIETPLTQKGMFLGTQHYAAPEVIRQLPDHTIDGRADIFALGVMMYQCMTGSLPFQHVHDDPVAVMYHTAHERPQRPRERAPERQIPPDVDNLIMKAMEIDPARRFASAAALMAAIRATTRPSIILPSSGGSFEVPPSTIPPSASAPSAPASGPSAPASSTSLQGSEAGLPLSPGVEPSGGSPTIAHATDVRASIGVIAILVGMLLGLVTLVALIINATSEGADPRTAPAASPSRK